MGEKLRPEDLPADAQPPSPPQSHEAAYANWQRLMSLPLTYYEPNASEGKMKDTTTLYGASGVMSSVLEGKESDTAIHGTFVVPKHTHHWIRPSVVPIPATFPLDLTGSTKRLVPFWGFDRRSGYSHSATSPNSITRRNCLV